jgi:leucyl-tRNA synthetase
MTSATWISPANTAFGDAGGGAVRRRSQDFRVGKEAYTGPGKLANSRFLDGMTVEQAKSEVAARLEKAGIGERTVNYRLRDWLVSRQRPGAVPSP